MIAKEAPVVRAATTVDKSCVASMKSSAHATQNIAPAAKPRPTCLIKMRTPDVPEVQHEFSLSALIRLAWMEKSRWRTALLPRLRRIGVNFLFALSNVLPHECLEELNLDIILQERSATLALQRWKANNAIQQQHYLVSDNGLEVRSVEA